MITYIHACRFSKVAFFIVLFISIQGFGLSLRALKMMVWEMFHLVGKGYAKKDKSSITLIVTGRFYISSEIFFL